jgi:hypothetical protein
MTESDQNAEVEDTLVQSPLGGRRRRSQVVAIDDEVTRVYKRPKFPTPVEWAETPRRKRKPRDPSHHTVTKTRPAFRYLVGMPVAPELAPPTRSAPKPPKRTEPASAPVRKALAILAVVTTTLAVALAFTASPADPSSEGFVVVSATAPGAQLSNVVVLADGEQRCTSLPCEIAMAPGDHFVAVVAPGYQRETSRRVSVAEGVESNVHFELAPRAD